MSIDHNNMSAPHRVELTSRTDRWIKVTLLAIAAIEVIGGLSNIIAWFSDDPTVPGPGLGGVLVKAYIATRPFLTVAASIFAIKGNLQGAVITIATVVLMTWLNEMPSVVRHGFDLRGPLWFETPVQIIAFPLLAVCAIALAARNERFGLATFFVSLPTLYGIFSVIAFGISIGLYGF